MRESLESPLPQSDLATAALRSPLDFLAATPALLCDSDRARRDGSTARDGRHVSARWPGAAHRLAHEPAAMLAGKPAS